MKKYIPNILTMCRLLAIPFIVCLGINNHIWLLIIIAIIIALTDFLDGFLARRWNVTSDFGKKMDTIADKALAIGLLFLLIIKNHSYLYVLILECLIAIFNLYAYFKSNMATSLMVGKLKTWFIFITIILGFVNIIFPSISLTIKWLVYITCFMQILTIISYVKYYLQYKKENKDEFSLYIEFYQLVEPFILNKEFIKRKKFPHHINESVYDHVLRVSFDCFKIAKKRKYDYKSLTIAALLHDFYDKPWQLDKEKKPFFKQHGFTHAKNAIVTAKKVYGDKITPKMEEIIETHMFPLNIRPPRSKEAWLLTLVDKADSIDFIMHPIMLFHIFRGDEIDQERKMTMRKILGKVKKFKKKKQETTD